MTQPSGTMLFPLENNRNLLRQGECLDIFRIISSKMFNIVCLIQNMNHLKKCKIYTWVFLLLYQASARSQNELLCLPMGTEVNSRVKAQRCCCRHASAPHPLASPPPANHPTCTSIHHVQKDHIPRPSTKAQSRNL